MELFYLQINKNRVYYTQDHTTMFICKREKRAMLPIQLYIVKSPMKKYLYFPLFEGDFYFIKKYIYFSSLKFVDFWIFNFWTIDFVAEKPYLHTLIFITLHCRQHKYFIHTCATNRKRFWLDSSIEWLYEGALFYDKYLHFCRKCLLIVLNNYVCSMWEYKSLIIIFIITIQDRRVIWVSIFWVYCKV